MTKRMKPGKLVMFTMFAHQEGRVFWCIVPRGMTEEEAINSQEHHGPFPSVEKAQADAEHALFGDTKIEDAAPGEKLPPWDKAH
jgi:hypothetical protein